MYLPKGETPCTTNDPELWLGDRDDTKKSKVARALCRLCPERRDCFDSTKRFELNRGLVQPVILAGFSQRERRAKYLPSDSSETQQNQTA